MTTTSTLHRPVSNLIEALDVLRDLAADQLGRRVDLTTRRGLHPKLRPRIEASAVRVI
jgi:predicted nucleotidyltransferase